MPGTAADFFGAMQAEYDSLIMRAVPRYTEMTAALVATIPAGAQRVLELGCGTGNLTLATAAHCPDAAITFVDAAPEMVQLTTQRLGERLPKVAARATPLVARFEDLSVAGRGFDVITSAISLHHVADKSALFKSLFALLRPGGALRFADQFRGGTPAQHDRNWNDWLAYCRQPGNCSDAEIESLLAHAEAHDHYVPVADQLEMMRAAGFTGLDCVWRSGMWGVVTGDRPA